MMDPVLHEKIRLKLLWYLNRKPTEQEIVNGQTDATLMQWIVQDEINALIKGV